MLMETRESSLARFRPSGSAAERRTVFALIVAYWVGFQIVYFTYAELRQDDKPIGAGAWLRGLAAYLVEPCELIICGLGALLCYGIYLLVKTGRDWAFWQQLLLSIVITTAGAFIFAAIVQLTMVVTMDMPITPRSLTQGGMAWIAPIGLWTVTVLALSYNAEVRDRERRMAMLQAQAHEAHVRALRYQVNPHFLFNTLNSISALILERRTEDAERMVLALAGFFRTTIAADPLKDVRLADEIALQKLYLDIEQIRFADCLAVEIDMPAELEDARLPGLILQPLVENALKHGVRGADELVLVRIGARREADLLVIEVRDNGPGGKSSVAGAGIGLPNVRERLVTRFGTRARVNATMQPSGFTVRLTMPLEFA